jgi:hypothetical protein
VDEEHKHINDGVTGGTSQVVADDNNDEESNDESKPPEADTCAADNGAAVSEENGPKGATRATNTAVNADTDKAEAIATPVSARIPMSKADAAKIDGNMVVSEEDSREEGDDDDDRLLIDEGRLHSRRTDKPKEEYGTTAVKSCCDPSSYDPGKEE